MSRVRVLVGTRKGAFILTSDGTRKQWDVTGPHFGGWELYHLKGSSADPNRLYASQTSSWFGQVIQRSDDGGKTWNPPGTKPEDLMGADGMPNGASNMFVYDQSAETGKPLTTHQHYDGTQRPWEFKRVWHLEPSLTDPDTVYAGVEDAALFRSTDGGRTWHELAGLRRRRLPLALRLPSPLHRLFPGHADSPSISSIGRPGLEGHGRQPSTRKWTGRCTSRSHFSDHERPNGATNHFRRPLLAT